MNTFTQTLKRNAYGLAALLMLVSMIAPALLASSASAALVTSRSLKLSSAAPSATNVTYHITFDPPSTSTTIKSIVVDFCTTALLKSSCTKPGGFSITTTPAVSNITGLTGGSWTADDLAGTTQRTLTLTNATAVTPSSTVSFDLTTATNPNTANTTFFGRIYTFASDSGVNSAVGYPTDGFTGFGTEVDSGAVASSTSNTVGVTATVVETLTFCVFGNQPTTGCTPPGSNATPSITLGHGSPALLDQSAVDTADVYFQVSTNAAGTTSVRAKGSATLSSGTNTITSAGATATNITSGMTGGRFGARVLHDTSPLGTEVGAMAAAAPYATANYALDNSNTGNEVTGAYGTLIADNSGGGGGYIHDYNNILRFAATAGPTTAAGVYTAGYSLIATPSY
jgi:hypothetical protein